MPTTLITNATIINEGTKRKGSVLINNGIIENISRKDPKKAQYLLSKNIRKYSNLKVSVQDILEAIWEKQLENFSKGFTDDTTMLAIEYTGK